MCGRNQVFSVTSGLKMGIIRSLMDSVASAFWFRDGYRNTHTLTLPTDRVLELSPM